jgi:hypothetical protein
MKVGLYFSWPIPSRTKGARLPNGHCETRYFAAGEILLRNVLQNAARAIPRGEASVSIVAVQHIRRMRGGAQGHLMRCSDNHFYVVKFRNNPQHLRVLANELLATRLAEQLGLPVPATEVVEVGECLIEHTPDLNIQLAHQTVACASGLQFGSRYVVSPLEGRVFDYMPIDMMDRVRNLETFAGMLAFDKWTGNSDARQATFWRKSRGKKYTAAFIDQGYCFNAGEWTFPDDPLKGAYAQNVVYQGVLGWQSFEPWLSRIECMKEHLMWRLALEIPSEWYGGALHELEKLVAHLTFRRGNVRDLIDVFRLTPRRPFPEWHGLSRGCEPI